jgi:3-deoxy-manno-octulosonate cytidylyltransferase (CMP-KDO synthetase)
VHIGLYGYRRPFLFRIAALPPSTLEQSEKLEQLRVLEHGCAIKVAVVQGVHCAVDRPEDVRKVERLMAKSHMKEGKIR